LQDSIDMPTDSHNVTTLVSREMSSADRCLYVMLTSRGMNTDLPLQLLPLHIHRHRQVALIAAAVL